MVIEHHWTTKWHFNTHIHKVHNTTSCSKSLEHLKVMVDSGLAMNFKFSAKPSTQWITRPIKHSPDPRVHQSHWTPTCIVQYTKQEYPGMSCMLWTLILLLVTKTNSDFCIKLHVLGIHNSNPKCQLIQQTKEVLVLLHSSADFPVTRS